MTPTVSRTLVVPRVGIVMNCLYVTSVASWLVFTLCRTEPPVDDERHEYAVNPPPTFILDGPTPNDVTPVDPVTTPTSDPPTPTDVSVTHQTTPATPTTPPAEPDHATRPTARPPKQSVPPAPAPVAATPPPQSQPTPPRQSQPPPHPTPPPQPAIPSVSVPTIAEKYGTDAGRFESDGRNIAQYQLPTVDDYVQAAKLCDGEFVAYNGTTVIRIGRALEAHEAALTPMNEGQLSLFALRGSRLPDDDPRVVELCDLVRSKYKDMQQTRILLALPPEYDNQIFQVQEHWFAQYHLEPSDRYITHGRFVARPYRPVFRIDSVTDLDGRPIP